MEFSLGMNTNDIFSTLDSESLDIWEKEVAFDYFPHLTDVLQILVARRTFQGHGLVIKDVIVSRTSYHLQCEL